MGAHRSKETVAFMQEADITLILNVGYSPEFNPIEGCFSHVKRFFVRERLGALANNRLFDTDFWIKKSFKLVTLDCVRVNVTKSLRLLRKLD